MRRIASTAGGIVVVTIGIPAVLALASLAVDRRIGWQLPSALWPVGAAFVVAALAIVGWGHLHLWRAGGSSTPIAPAERLATSGPFAYSRNPMYVAWIALLAGLALGLASPALLLATVTMAAIVAAYVRRVEEPELARRFGRSYEAYRARVPRFLPLGTRAYK